MLRALAQETRLRILALGPRLRLRNAAAQTRIVSAARIRLDSRKFVRPFKQIICGDVSEFESHMPRQAVGSPPAIGRWPATKSPQFACWRRQGGRVRDRETAFRIGLRGGPGRSRNFAGRQRLTERCGRLGCFEAKKLFSFVPAPYGQGDAAKRARCSGYSTGFITTNPPHRGRERRTPPRDLQAGHPTAPACAVEVDVKDRRRGSHRWSTPPIKTSRRTPVTNIWKKKVMTEGQPVELLRDGRGIYGIGVSDAFDFEALACTCGIDPRDTRHATYREPSSAVIVKKRRAGVAVGGGVSTRTTVRSRTSTTAGASSTTRESVGAGANVRERSSGQGHAGAGAGQSTEGRASQGNRAPTGARSSGGSQSEPSGSGSSGQSPSGQR